MVENSSSLISQPAVKGGPQAIEAIHISRLFGREQALRDVSLTVERGAVCGLLGPNGSGKTTLIRILVGHLRPTSGEARILGHTLASDPLGIRRRLGYVSDVRYLYDWMTVREILGFTRAFHDDWDDGKEQRLVARFALPMDRKISQLSRGHRARLSLTLALAHNPELIILDELTAGLDPLVRREVLENLIEEIGREGRTVLFSSHSAEEVERLADQVVIMQAGSILIDSSVDDLKRRLFGVRLRAIPDRDAIASIRGFVSVRELGDEVHLTLRDTDPESACAALARLGRPPQIVTMTLEEIFLELLRPRVKSDMEGQR